MKHYQKIKPLKICAFILFLCFLLIHCKPNQNNTNTQFAGKPEVPSSIQKEHGYLLAEIGKLTLLEDSTGKVAIKLNELMHHHFQEEEDYVLPPLGHLQLLAEGKIPPQSEEIIGLSERLKEQLNHMIAEHQLIKAYTEELVQVAMRENHPEVIALEEKIGKHAALEEEVLFPAAILIGEFLKLKTNVH